MTNPLQPTLHKPVPMNSRVRLPLEWCPGPAVGIPAKGTVVGIASVHVVFQYIVLLDTPIISEYGQQRAVVCGGPQLTCLETGKDWRFSSDDDRNQYLKQINGSEVNSI